MPEGDTIQLLARKLSLSLVGKKILAFSAHTVTRDIARTLVGLEIRRVEARGKNLLLHFEDERALHVHLRMSGRVRVARTAPRFPSQLVIEVAGAFVTGWKIPVLRLLRRGAAERIPEIATLGPDLLAEDFDENEAVARLRANADREIGDALLLQSALAGIGNVYKSEILFIERVNPFVRVRDLDDTTLVALVRQARKLLRLNVAHGGARVTRGRLGVRHYVYERARKPCFQCRTAIRVARQRTATGPLDVLLREMPVGEPGLEPGANGLKFRCSTN